VARRYVPARGDAIWLTFTPQAGHEQAGRRAALVLSPASYNGKVGLAILCPITSQVKGYPFEVATPAGARIGYEPHDRGSKAALSEIPTMKKMKRKISRLTSRSTDDEIIRWTKSHDVFDRLETGVSEVVEDHSDLDEVLREAIFQDNTAQLNMRLPPAMKAVLSKLARQRTTDATTLARIWLAERLERELKTG
jgi:mRNA-degrading endonuclease toxin of MazEF toxin-antitoxin module